MEVGGVVEEVVGGGGGGGGEKMWRRGEEGGGRRGEEKWRRGEGERRSGGEKGKREGEKRVPAGFKNSNPAQQFCGAWARHAPQNSLFYFFLFCWKNSSVGHNFFFVLNFENLKKVPPG